MAKRILISVSLFFLVGVLLLFLFPKFTLEIISDNMSKISKRQIEEYEKKSDEKSLIKNIFIYPNNEEFIYNLGCFYLGKAMEAKANGPLDEFKPNLEKAREQFNKILQINRNSIKANRGLGKIYLLERNYIQALSKYISILEKLPLDFEALYNVGVIYREFGNDDKARIYFDKAIQVAEHNEEIKNTIEYKRLLQKKNRNGVSP